MMVRTAIFPDKLITTFGSPKVIESSAAEAPSSIALLRYSALFLGLTQHFARDGEKLIAHAGHETFFAHFKSSSLAASDCSEKRSTKP